MDLLSMLMGSMTSDDSLNSLTKKTGISSSQLSGLVAMALPALLKAMQSNASSASGASSLMNALAQHTNQNSVAAQIADADTDDGDKIIGHILGQNTGSVVNQLAATNGLQSNQVNAVLASLAPALMSSLSQATKPAAPVQQQQAAPGLADLSGLMSLFGGVQQQAPQQQQSSGAGDLLGSLLSMLTK